MPLLPGVPSPGPVGARYRRGPAAESHGTPPCERPYWTMTNIGSSGALSVIVRPVRPRPNPWVWEMVDPRGALAGRSRVSYETADEAREAGRLAKLALETKSKE